MVTPGVGPGELLGDRFAIQTLIASGGMGSLWRAVDRSAGREVVVKTLRRTAPGAVDRFLREVEVLASLDHPAIVRHIDHGLTAGGEPYLVMELLEGVTLAERLARGRLSVADTAALLARIGDALAFAHDRGVVHRDIKPSNLFLVGGRADRAALIDFGVARPLEAAAALTRTGMRVGTPRYMAPEQARGRREADGRADLFSLGCVAYECLTGRPAFLGDDFLVILSKILFDEPVPPRERVAGIPAALDELVVAMMSKDPDGRPSDAGRVAEAAAGLLAGDLAGEDGEAQRDLTPDALTQAEWRLVSVILAWEAEQPAATGAAEKLAELARAHGGRLEPVAGGVVVVFPGGGSAADQAVQAARCALAMRTMLEGWPMVLATGRGLLGGGMPVGEALDRAGRLLAAAGGAGPAGAVALDELTRGLIEPRFEVRADPRGLELVAERHRTGEPRKLLGRATPFVGRQRELAVLSGLFAQCAEEQVARAVVVTAVAGMGKTRLKEEFLRQVESRCPGVAIWLGSGDPMHAGSPFGLLAPAVRRTAGIMEGEPLEVRRRKLAARIGRRLPATEAARVAEFLGELAEVPFEGGPDGLLRAARHDSRLMGDQVARAWQVFLRAECAAHPLVLVLEDLHWGDLPSVKAVDAALRDLAELPFLVLALARPEAGDLFPRLWADRAVEHIALLPLTRKAAGLLARSALGEVAPELVDRLVAQAAGSPLYLEELIRSVAKGEGDAQASTVLAMLQSRLEALEPDRRRLLRAASCFGEVFWRSGVEALVGDELAAEHLLAELEQREVVVRRPESRFAGEEEYSFRHALVRDAAYGMLPDADRVIGHRLVAQWLERAGEPAALVLAEHFELGGEPAQAIAWYRRSAEQALSADDLDAVLARVAHAAACGADAEALGRLRVVEAEAHYWRGDFAETGRVAEEAMRLIPRATSAWYRAVRLVLLAGSRLGEVERAEQLARELLSLGWGEQASDGQQIAWAQAVASAYLLSLIDLAAQLLAVLEDAVTRDAISNPTAQGLLHRARATQEIHRGDWAGYLVESEAAARAYQRAGDQRSLCQQQMNIGTVYALLGDFAAAEQALAEVGESAARLGLHNVWAYAKANRGQVLADQGVRLAEAEAEMTEALETVRAQGEKKMIGMCQCMLASLHTARGEFDQAERLARAAVEELAPLASQQATALARLANVLLARGDAGALAPAREAMERLDALGGVEQGEALIRHAYARALLAAGDRDGARAVVAAARRRLDEQAARIGDRDLRRSFLERVPDHRRVLDLAAELAAGSEN